MKKNLLTILSAITMMSTVAVAQPTLTATNYNPVSGDVLTLQQYSYINPGSSGANQTWNFTSITQSTNAAISYTYAAVASTNTAIFPNANQQYSSSTTIGFNQISTTALQNYGIKQGTVNIVYSNPEDQMHYPFAMGNTYTDPFVATFSNAGSNYLRYGTTTQTADAYGTIQLPGGTFSNVLRTHYVQNYKDSTNIAGFGPYVLNYYNDEYMFYLPNNHMPIFSTFSITVNSIAGSQSSSASNKLVTIVSGINEQLNYIQSMNFYPNPSTNGIINLDLNLNESIKYEITMYNNLGREVLRTNTQEGMSGYNFRTIDVSQIASGLYTMEIISNNIRLSNHKVVIK